AGCAVGAHYTELHRIVGGGIDSEPALTTVVGRGNVSMPHTIKWSAAVCPSAVSRRRCTDEKERGAIIVACSYFGKDSVVDPERNPYILVPVPRCTLVVRDGDVRVSILTYVAEVQTTLGSDSNGRIARSARAAGHVLDRKGKTIVARDDHSLFTAAV